MKTPLQVFAATFLVVLLSACSPSESQKEEAYQAGWDSIYDERVLGIEQPMMIPKKYDDSTGSGELVREYRLGIADAEDVFQ